MKSFIDYCVSTGTEYLTDEPLSSYLTFRVGGSCRVMAFPDTEEKLTGCVGFLRSNGIAYYLIGNGSNLIAPDEGFDGVVINTCNYKYCEVRDGEYIDCSCGVSLMSVCRLALENSLSGLEFAYGIPGTAGGAVYMNAGAYGGEMKDVLYSVKYLDSDGNIITAPASSLKLGYRCSLFSENDYTVLSLTVKLRKGSKDEIKAYMDELLGRRKSKQPLEYPSAGSTFKRPEGYFAGRLIEECGLKGCTRGGAQVSEKHAGFIINKGGATADDIFGLIEHCRSVVLKEKGILLEPEVKIIK